MNLLPFWSESLGTFWLLEAAVAAVSVFGSTASSPSPPAQYSSSYPRACLFREQSSGRSWPCGGRPEWSELSGCSRIYPHPSPEYFPVPAPPIRIHAFDRRRRGEGWGRANCGGRLWWVPEALAACFLRLCWLQGRSCLRPASSRSAAPVPIPIPDPKKNYPHYATLSARSAVVFVRASTCNSGYFGGPCCNF